MAQFVPPNGGGNNDVSGPRSVAILKFQEKGSRDVIIVGTARSAHFPNAALLLGKFVNFQRHSIAGEYTVIRRRQITHCFMENGLR